MIIGTVIGAGIYILIGSLAVEVGPGLFISYFIALVVAVSSSLCFAQIATIYPVTAGTYKYAKMFFSDYTGFIIGWLRLITGFYGLTLMATGFTEYVNTPFGINNKIIGIGLLFIFFIIVSLKILTPLFNNGCKSSLYSFIIFFYIFVFLCFYSIIYIYTF